MEDQRDKREADGPQVEITCIDCGGPAHLLTSWPEDDPPLPGDVLAYRCRDCGDRWDLVYGEDQPGLDTY